MIAITGAAGFLGSALARELLAGDERVRAIARKSSPMTALVGLDVELVTAELDDERSLARAFEGARAVCHAAGRVSLCRGEWPELYRSNVEGTKAVLGAAQAAGVRRLVYISSIEALDMAGASGPITEAASLVGEDGAMEYGRSKSLATQAVLAASKAGFETLAVYPTAVMGPLDFRTSSLGSMVRDFAAGALPAIIDGGFDFVDTRDVARGIELALRSGRPGEGYILGGRYAEIGELMAILERLSLRRGPRLKLPQWTAKAVAPWAELYYRATRRPARFTRYSVALLASRYEVDSTKAKRELGYSARALEETLADTLDWFRTQARG
jgi:dihydroflavonol-4-reductase